jgi:hypothetical protein
MAGHIPLMVLGIYCISMYSNLSKEPVEESEKSRISCA